MAEKQHDDVYVRMNTRVSKQIEELKAFIAEGDIAGMARIIEALHEDWDSLDAAAQKETQVLEAMFLSIVNLKVNS